MQTDLPPDSHLLCLVAQSAEYTVRAAGDGVLRVQTHHDVRDCPVAAVSLELAGGSDPRCRGVYCPTTEVGEPLGGWWLRGCACMQDAGRLHGAGALSYLARSGDRAGGHGSRLNGRAGSILDARKVLCVR